MTVMVIPVGHPSRKVVSMRAQHLVEWADALPTLLPREGQDPLLIGVVHLDDACLLRNPHALWFHVLLKHDWTQYREIECGYYNALRAFNKCRGPRKSQASFQIISGRF
jgi:hypothetical protein